MIAFASRTIFTDGGRRQRRKRRSPWGNRHRTGHCFERRLPPLDSLRERLANHDRRRGGNAPPCWSPHNPAPRRRLCRRAGMSHRSNQSGHDRRLRGLQGRLNSRRECSEQERMGEQRTRQRPHRKRLYCMIIREAHGSRLSGAPGSELRAPGSGLRAPEDTPQGKGQRRRPCPKAPTRRGRLCAACRGYGT